MKEIKFSLSCWLGIHKWKYYRGFYGNDDFIECERCLKESEENK